jgi:arginine-tRNA-protein transferase
VKVLAQFVTPPHACPYLEGKQAKFDYSFAPDLSPAEYEQLMNSEHRKFGAAFFKPVCEGCRACRPIRIPVATFAPDRSQRRARRDNQDLEVRRGAPVADASRLDLYNRYHEAQASRKLWPEQDKDREEYLFSFVRNPIPSVEISVWEKKALRGVILTEVTPNVVSDIYHYHDLTAAQRSLGTFLILETIELAKTLGKPYVYLGYYVAGCASMEYKARFRPCEVLGTDGVWRPLTPESGSAKAS